MAVMASDEQHRGGGDATREEAIASLSEAELRKIVWSTAQRHAEVEREVRLVAARASGDLTLLPRRSRPQAAHVGGSSTLRSCAGATVRY